MEINQNHRTVEATPVPTGFKVDHQNIAWARTIIYQLTNKKFFGRLVFSLENGVILGAKVEESLKPKP